MAIGASWGILLLLGVTAGVLTAFAGFFLYLVKRSRMALGTRVAVSGSHQARGSV
jgi:maltodextrin utilization protein YvdJ